MKVADVSAFYAPAGGGVRTYVERKLAYAEKAGIELSVIVPGAADRIERRGRRTQLIHVASPKLVLDRRYRYFAAAKPVHDLLDRLTPDIVEASSPWRTASIVAEWRGRAARALVMHADPLAAYAYRWFGAIAARESIDRGFDWFWAHLRRVGCAYDVIVSPNPDLGQRLTQGSIARVVTIPLGVEPGIFSPARRDPAIRASLLQRCGLGNDALLLIGVGRHSPEKRWPMIVEAVARAGLSRPIGFVLIGQGGDRPRIERAIGANPHIALLPPISSREHLADLYASADALIHGCEAETFGLVPAEAAASGLPLIVPDKGGAAMQAHAACSEHYRAADLRAAAAAILRLAEGDSASLSDIATAQAAKSRTIDVHFADLLACYAALPSQYERATLTQAR